MNTAEVDLDRLVDYEREYRSVVKMAQVTGDHMIGLCPFHDDSKNSFSVDLKTGRWHCFSEDIGGNYVDFVAKMNGISTKDAYKRIMEDYHVEMPEKEKPAASRRSYSMEQYAFEKRLPVEFLRDTCHISNDKERKDQTTYMKIPYLKEDGTEATYRKRFAGKEFRWRYGSSGKICLYGEWRLPQMRQSGYACLVEGESDTQSMTNKERFIELLRSTKREGIEKLIDFLEKTDFFTAPASTRFHMSCEGGLLQHSLNVYDCLAGLGTTTGDVQEFQAAGMRLDSIPQESIIIVALLHDLCKVNFYATEMRWRKDANQKWEQYPVYTVNDRNPYGHGEKSVMMASEFIHLTMEERYAIRWHMGMSEANIIQTYCQAAEKYPLVLFTHMADQMATSYLETNTGNKKPEDIYLGTEPAAQDPEEFAEAEPI